MIVVVMIVVVMIVALNASNINGHYSPFQGCEAQ
jgi:hypothetical protein